MDFLSVPRLSRLDVKWASHIKGNYGVYLIEHYNPYFELITVTQGPIYLRVNEEKLTLAAGETLILTPWEKHGFWKEISEDAGFFWIQFSSSPPLQHVKNWTKTDIELFFVHMNHKDLRIDADDTEDMVLLPRQFKPSRVYELLGMYEKLAHAIENPKGYFKLKSAVYMIQIVDLLANDYLEQYHLDTTLPTTYITYRNLIAYLNQKYIQKTDKDDMEKMLSLSYEYMGQIFKKHSGISMSSYIQQLRIQRSKFLLKSSFSAVHDIAREVGYEDALYFSRVFKKLVGKSPLQYRNSVN
ncbi:AraC family transcriptional regulator [Paenibacillus eucommiae]|uniref:AraC-like DNA-binding protein n=1 Tax=Paenibacillus eucommiae TaxID=1355755 RepID=A0ABS4J5L7_9BACL|nr:AraC family transcriptional regulator [Paenibacillus eucommiae]MBP1995100.1 AraC-like DNA-binding protein [Paenibacillus eucommiae]